jgi:hypothetical protein
LWKLGENKTTKVMKVNWGLLGRWKKKKKGGIGDKKY